MPILWEFDIESVTKTKSKEEVACEKNFKTHIKREESGRYRVNLPFNEKRDSLGNSRNTAYQRFYALERKFEKNPKFKDEYAACSAKTTSGLSLNDSLMVGPSIQEDLVSIITRFRCFRYALTADIEQMYWKIRVASEDCLYQKILWRNSPQEPIQIYSLNTVTFGTACAPFLSIRTLHQITHDERELFPNASAILERDFYMDDLLTGAKTVQEAINL